MKLMDLQVDSRKLEDYYLILYDGIVSVTIADFELAPPLRIKAVFLDSYIVESGHMLIWKRRFHYEYFARK
jgi:hypothetical protein